MPIKVKVDNKGAGRLSGAPGHRSLRPVPGADQHRLAGPVSRRTEKKGRTLRPYPYLKQALAAVADRVRGDDPERGDVPGWVMITVMTAALVLAILIPFRAAIVEAVTNALDSVTSVG